MNDISHKHLNLIVGAIAALGGVVAFLTYINGRKTQDVKNAILNLDHDLKLLEIERAKIALAQSPLQQ